jgi:hypothetical protein
MKKILYLILFCTLISTVLFAQMDWIDFQNNGEGEQEPQMIIVNDSTIRIDFFGAYRTKKLIDDTLYDVLKLSGMNGKTIDIGLPELPLKACYFEVSIDTPSISINAEDYIILNDFYIMPAQEPSGQDTVFQFIKNDSIYASNGFFPSWNSRISLPQTLREHKVSSLIFYPVQFNPVSKQLRVFKHIEIIVHGAKSEQGEKDNAYFDSYLDGLILNYEKNDTPDEIIDLLIITPDEYYSSLLPFKDWKESVGIRTEIISRSTIEAAGYLWEADPIGQDWIYEGIDAYIKDYYNNVTGLTPNTPEFLLFVGETDPLTPEMPTHYWQYYFGPGWPQSPTTDLYYTTMDISEFSVNSNYGLYDLPDMFSGRISVDSVQELDIVLNKIINYEKNPFLEQTNWYNNINLSSYFEAIIEGIPSSSDCDCREYLYFIYTSNSVYDYLFQKNYNLDRVFYNSWLIEHPDDILCTYWLEHLPTNIPYYLYAMDATNAVLQSINNGCFLVNHRGHGQSRNINSSSDGWLFPAFNQNHIDLLSNDKMLPVMFSINCQTGWFDGGSDDLNQIPQYGNFDCLGEMLLSKENGGVVGFIGSTRTARSGYTDEFCYGLYDAIWDDFDPYNNEIQTPIYKLGAIKDYGLLYSLNKFALGNATTPYEGLANSLKYNRKHVEQFHVLGDPTLEIWTGVPQPLYAYVDYTQNMVTVYDDNGQIIPEAKVVLQHGTDYIVQMTDINGHIISSLLNNNYDVEVSALKHNYIPWYSTKITSSQTWNANEKVRGNIIITNGSTLTFASDITIPRYSRIIVEPEATLKVNNGVTVSFENGFNDILAFGNLMIQPNANMVMTLPGSGTERAKIELKNETITYSYKDVDFTKCVVKGIPFMLRLENTDFENGSVEIEKANVEILTSDFQNSFVTAKFPRNKSGYAYIKQNSTFSGTPTAIFIDGYYNYQISDCSITSCIDGIKIFNSGGSANERRIIENEIFNNSGIGITIYRSYTLIVMNNIYNNGYGIHSLDRSNVYIGGNNLATVPAETQQIKDNLLNEVYATNYGFPYYFKWNAVIDEDNHEPMVYYAGILGANLDVSYNYWGVNFAPATDFYPWQYFNYFPVWPLGGGSSSSGPEELYFSAQENIDQGEYAAAKSDYQQIVTEYPASLYSQAALRELWSIEEEVENDYSTLKSYYNTEPNIISTPELTKLADFLANFCDIKLENWSTAIAWFENVIQEPETFEDSIFAIIDLGYTYWLMENSGLKSSYTGALSQYKFGSQMDYEENRDYLLSLLPGDGLSETIKQNLSTLKTGELLQNVPNPFNGTTQIWFKLNDESSVAVNVFDYTGKRIRSFEKGVVDKGSHYVEFSAQGLPSGIYFYSLEVNGMVSDSKKMTVLK